MKNEQKVIAGGVLVAVAVGLAFLLSGGGNTKTSCALAASGVGLVADGLARHETAASIVASVSAATAVGAECESAIKTLVAKPESAVKLKIEAPNGATVDREATSEDLTQAPPPQQSAPPNLFNCFKYQGGFLIKLCLDGAIPVPS